MILSFGTTPALARTMCFERLAIDGVNRAAAVHEYAAGKAVNAARAVRTLGESVTCVGPCGGSTGRRLAEQLRAAFGDASVTVEVAAQTRLCVTLVDRAAGTSTELIEEAAALTGDEGERLATAFADRLRDARVVLLCGSLAPGLASDYYAHRIAEATERGVTSILDASGEPLRLAIEARPSVVKVNAAELAGIAPFPVASASAIIGAAAKVAGRTGGWVIVTRGRDPTIAVHAGEGVLRASVPAVKAVSPIGSGDSFAGGLAVALMRGRPMEAALKLATACATANVLSEHAAHFSAEQVRAIERDVMVGRDNG